MILNPGFESPSLGANGPLLNPTNAGWTFSGNSGVVNQQNTSGYENNSCPQGSQAGYLRPYGSMAQTITVPYSDNYQLTYWVQGND
jgi:hypothetical protein